ncbi:phosphoribosyltransferase-like protein [Neobacillus sp. SAB-20_R2A]|uniref:phosphoribosyltransferase-like protein n=1 Tax=Neobacillus sp. SAB-20_R2A TaxID=3120519 RepID=UPI003C6E41B6
MFNYKDIEPLLNLEDNKAKRDHSNFFKFTFNLTFPSDLIGLLGKEKVREWFNQFDPEDLDVASNIFSKIQYYDNETVKNLCKIAFLEWQVKTKAKINETLFIPLGTSGKSGQMIGYLFRTANGIPPKLIKYQDFISKEDIIRYKNIVFLDDFTGTGNQFLTNITVQNILEYIEDIKDSKEAAPILSFVSLVSTMEARENINNSCGNILFISPQVRERSYFDDDDEFINFNEKYGRNLYKFRGESKHLGFGDIGETIVFFYNVPNNTLPIIWSSAFSNQINKNWIPLFQRSTTVLHITSDIDLRNLYTLLSETTLYDDEYIFWVDIIKDLYVNMDASIFNIEELNKILMITSNLLHPFDFGIKYNSPLAFLNIIRKDLLNLVYHKVKSDKNKSNFIGLLDSFESDKFSVDQELILMHQLTGYIVEFLIENPDYINICIENFRNIDECVYKIQGTFKVLNILQDNLNLEPFLPVFYEIRNGYSSSDTLKYFLELLISKIEKRNINLTDVNLNNAKRFVNVYGEYSVRTVQFCKDYQLF